MKNTIFLFLFVVLTTALTVKLTHDAKKGYSYTISGGSAEEVIDAELKMKNYIRKGKIPTPVKIEDKKQSK